MASALRPVSGLLDLDFAIYPLHPAVLQQPSAHHPELSRVLFHETVHFWQHAGQGFLARMAEEDWQRLRRFEEEDVLSAAGAYRQEFVRIHPDLGFSARDLHESLARFWDIHVIGPHRLLEMDFADSRRAISEDFKAQYFAHKKEGRIIHPQHGGYSSLAFDLAMDASAGNYARPFQYLGQTGCNPIGTGALFPLAGHFALQTKHPIDFFPKFVEAALPVIAGPPKNQSIHDIWRFCYKAVRDRALEIAKSQQDELLSPALLIQDGPLQAHPVYAWIYSQICDAVQFLGNSQLAASLFKPFYTMSLGDRGKLALDFSLACPGDPECRSVLLTFLVPPYVRFSDGQYWRLADFYRRQELPRGTPDEGIVSVMCGQAADSAPKIQDRWNSFLDAQCVY